MASMLTDEPGSSMFPIFEANKMARVHGFGSSASVRPPSPTSCFDNP